MNLRLPDLDPNSSGLLQATLDDRFFRVTDFAADGAFPRHRDIKDEVERLVAAIQRANSRDVLLEAAARDPRFMPGSSLANPRPYSADAGTRPIAFRQLELLLAHEIGAHRNSSTLSVATTG